MEKSTKLEASTKNIAQHKHEYVRGGAGNDHYNNIEANIKKLNEIKESDHKADADLITKITNYLIKYAQHVDGLNIIY